ncbi:MAG: MarR family transcriptional regulator [Alphaproteobacteria bacterium]|nr:MarR family transcriptional regulator [Alphaproteobacteria bacterium]MCB9694744.1 MarR family transcriptional regulator [Alphaproteobacteria bacterium]
MSTRERIHRALGDLAVRSYLHQAEVAAGLELHPTDHQALQWLRQAGPASAGQLATALGVTSGGATAVVDRLVERGFVERGADPSDRRRVLVALVEGEARRALAGRYAGVADRVERVLEGRTEAEREVIAGFLEELTSRP